MQSLRQPPLAGKTRRGFTVPVVALTLIIAMAGLALLLDRLWLDAAQLELTTAAEAAALATARELASDDLLRRNVDSADRIDSARKVAESVAGANRVAGQLPSFNGDASDLSFGNYADGAFQPDEDDPCTVCVTLHRTRARNNPVALFIGELTRVPFGDVIRRADATIDNHIGSVTTVSDAPVPALPIAIWKVDPTGNRQDTWKVQIDDRKGSDKYAIDDETGRPMQGKDGIREIVVKSLAGNGCPEACNLQLLDIGTKFDDEQLHHQMTHGFSTDDLESFGGLFSPAVTLNSSANLLHAERNALEEILGQPRICLLFSQTVSTGKSPFTTTTCTEFIAVRVMAVKDEGDGSCTLTLQPTVIATRNAVPDPAASPNKYVYNLQLTN